MKTANCVTKNGSVVVEVVIAVVVFSMVIAIALPVLESQFQELTRLTVYSQMLFRARALLEKTIVYDAPQKEIGVVPGISVQSSIVTVEPCVNETFATANQTTRSLTINTLYAPPLTVAALGKDCGGYMSPQSLVPPFTFSAPTAITSGLTSMDFFAGDAYVGASTTDGYNFLISNPAQSTISRVAVPPVNMVDVADGYAYLATAGTTSQLQVMDVRNQNQPQLVATRSLPGVAGSYPSGLSVYYYASKVYIGTHRTAGNEFHIFDVTTPTNPRWLGSLEVNHNINDIIVANNYAYLATSGNTSDIIVLNISNPARPIKIADLTLAGSEDTEKLFLLGSTLYAGRLKGTSSAHPELTVINVASSSSPLVVATASLAANVTGLRAIVGELLVTTSVGIFSLTTNRSGSGPFLGMPKKVWPQAVLGLDYENNMLYTIAATSSAIMSFKHL